MSKQNSSKITLVSGDLFTAPPKSILIHACNTRGSWGAGIALAFKERFPQAFSQYKRHCEVHGDDLIGSCFLVPADNDGDSERIIACLFTSRRYGKQKDTPEEILEATESAMKDLMRQNEQSRHLHACRFNSGKFAVPWGETQKILEKLEVEMTIHQVD